MSTEARIRIVRILEATQTTEADAQTRAAEAFSDPDSLSGRVEAVHRAFSKAYPSDSDRGVWNHVEEIYDNRVLARVGEDTVEIPYTVGDDGTADFGKAKKVKVTLAVSATESVSRETSSGAVGPILEALDESGEGRVWRVTMVRPGVSKNGRRYQPHVLTEAVALYEGAKSFDGHRDVADRKRSAIGGMVGWHENVEVATDGSLTSDFHIAESREDIRQLFLTAWKNRRPDLIGFSHDVSAVTEAAIVGGRRISDVKKIVEVHAVDVVSDPSAGGQIERLVASRHEEDTMNLEQFLRALRAGDLTEAQIAEAYASHPEWEQIAEAFDAEVQAAVAAGTTPPAPTVEPPAAATSDSPELSGVVRELVIESAVRRAGLPEAAHARVTEALEGANTEAEILARVNETRSIWDAALAAAPSALAGQGAHVAAGEEEMEKKQHALDAMVRGQAQVEGVPAYRSVKEAYADFTGRNPYTMGEEDFSRWILAESVGAVPYAGAQRLSESVATSTWGEAFGDSIRRALVAEYSLSPLQSWRQIVSEIGTLTDFRTNRRVRIGGYDVLPTVAEGAAYTALTTPADEEATYAPTKKGGTEDYTLESIANDDLSALRRIPRKLGRSAALTLYRLIWNTLIAGNATIYDAVALFAAGHNNDTATLPLDETGITTLRTKMIRQTQQGETSGFVGLLPKFLAVPPEQYVTAFKLTQSGTSVVGAAESATTPNPYQGLMPLEVPTFTDTNDWYLIADPGSVPTIEVGFYQGRQDPELFIQDQPAVGSVFTNDTFTWKIRHIYGAAVLDYRGFQRATQV